MALLSYASRKMNELRGIMDELKFSMKEELDYWQNNLKKLNSLSENMPLIVGGTPEYLQHAGLSNLPITLDKRHAIDIIQGKADADHAINMNTLMNLPQIINTPVAVIKSKKREATSVIIVLDIKHM